MKMSIRQAIKLSVPVMIGYVFLGIAFGLLCQKQGYSFLWAALISCTVYAGSMQVGLLSFFYGGAHLFEVALVTLSVNARQLFYGLSCIHKFQNMGWRKWYMIFSLTDETYSLLCSMNTPETKEDKQQMFLVALFDQLYWIGGSIIGGLLGSALSFDTTGIDFSMTALFTVILVEQWLSSTHHIQVGIALGSALICVVIWHTEFLLPSLILCSIMLMILRNWLERREAR